MMYPDAPYPALDEENASILAYVRIEQSIRKKIETFVWHPGDKIPSEPELAREYAVSIGTVKKAMQNLVVSGFLYRIQGKGTYVAGSFVRSSKLRFYTTYAKFGVAELLTTPRFLRCESQKGSDDVCQYLGIENNSQIILLERLLYTEEKPFVFVRSHFEAARFPDLVKVDGLRFEKQALPLIIEKDYATPTMAAEELISSVTIPAEVAKHLHLSEDSSVLFIEMLSMTYSKTPYEYRQSYCVPGRKIFRNY